jgi:hypothetical protein
MSTNSSIAIIGGNGFIGSHLTLSFIKNGDKVDIITRDNYDEHKGIKYKYIVNSAMPSGRFWAKKNPRLDFDETVAKTSSIKNDFSESKIIQISSISAKVQLNTIYGRHKLAAENLLDHDNDLIIRLGPLYSNTIKKGAIIDIIDNKTVYVSGKSKYAFTSLDWVCNEIVNNKSLNGIHEFGAKNFVTLQDLAIKINSKSDFVGDIDDQIFYNASDKCPEANEVIEFIQNKKMEI